MHGFVLFPSFQNLALTTRFGDIELATRRGQREIKCGLQIISLSVCGSFDFARATLWDTFETDPAWPSGLRDRRDRPPVETVYVLGTEYLAAELHILLLERDVSRRACLAQKLRPD